MPLEATNQKRPGWKQHLQRAPAIIRSNRNFRMLFLMRVGSSVVGLSSPFYALYAFQVLGAPDAMGGTFISVLALSGLLSNLFWSQIGDRYGNKLLLQWGMATSILGPLLALLLPLLASDRGAVPGWLSQLTSSESELHNLYLLAFVGIGVSRTALMIAGLNYLLDIAPAAERPTYIGLMNTFSAPLMLTPMLGGYLIDWLPFQVVFLISLVAAVLTLPFAFRIAEPRQI